MKIIKLSFVCLIAGIVASYFIYVMDKKADKARIEEGLNRMRRSSEVYAKKFKIKDLFKFNFVTWMIIVALGISAGVHFRK